MKLKVYQQGGGLIYTPFIPEQFVDSDSRASARGSSSSSGDEDEKINPLDKELLGMMKDKSLLPSDINIIYKKLIQFQRKSQHLSELGDSSYRSVMPGMLQLMNLVNQAKANKDDWDDKLTEIKHHNAGSEVAMDSYGRMWVNTEDGIKKINPSEFDPEKHAPISNSQLMNLRQRNPSLAFQDDLFGETGMDVVGGADVRKEIDDIIDKFGTIKSGEFKKQVFKDIASDLKGEGIFKIATKYSKADLNDFSGLLFSRLSAPAKHLIKANAAIGGYDPTDYIRSIITSQTDVEIDPSYEASLSKANGLGGAGGSGADGETLNTHDTYPERIATGADIIPHWEMIETKNSGHKLWAYAQSMGPILKDGKGMGVSSLNDILTDFDATGIIDWAHVTFGDSPLQAVDFPKVIYDGTSQIQRVWLPVTNDGSIDFTAQKQMSDLQNWINDNGVINEAAIQERVSEIPNAEWDSEKKIVKFNLSKCKPFLVIRGITSSDMVRFDTKSPYVWNMEKGEDDIRKEWMDVYNNMLENGTPAEGKKKYDYGKSAGRHLYEGNIYLPITSQTIGALIYNDQWFSKNVYHDIRNQAENKEKEQTLIGNYKR